MYLGAYENKKKKAIEQQKKDIEKVKDIGDRVVRLLE